MDAETYQKVFESLPKGVSISVKGYNRQHMAKPSDCTEYDNVHKQFRSDELGKKRGFIPEPYKIRLAAMGRYNKGKVVEVCCTCKTSFISSHIKHGYRGNNAWPKPKETFCKECVEIENVRVV